MRSGEKKRGRAAAERVPSVLEEFLGVELGDERRNRRLLSLVELFVAAPDKTLPEMANDGAVLEATYRLLNNDQVFPHDILEPHFEATAQRAAEHKTVLVIHDASEISYELGDELREGLGRIGGNRQGFKVMPALALSADGTNRPLGLLASQTWTEDDHPKKAKKSLNKPGRRRMGGWGRITAERWLQSISESAANRNRDFRRIHVIDSEGEGFKLFHSVLESGDGFTIRFRAQRNVAFESNPKEFLNVADAAKRLEGLLEVEVELSARKAKPGMNERHAPRSARTARLQFSAARVLMKKSWDLNQTDPDLPEYLPVNLVSVIEPGPPEGEEPVEWLLATSEPIDTVEDVKRVVATYKARWLVEEFFKQLKSGCAFEERQLESYGTLGRLLAIFLVIAWWILALRSACRLTPHAPASSVMSPRMLWTLRASRRQPLPENPTVHDVLYAVAGLGGHIKNNGPPGPTVLRRGMERLLERTAALVSAMELVSESAKQ